jgi:hypothetical protein
MPPGPPWADHRHFPTARLLWLPVCPHRDLQRLALGLVVRDSRLARHHELYSLVKWERAGFVTRDEP